MKIWNWGYAARKRQDFGGVMPLPYRLFYWEDCQVGKKSHREVSLVRNRNFPLLKRTTNGRPYTDLFQSLCI